MALPASYPDPLAAPQCARDLRECNAPVYSAMQYHDKTLFLRSSAFCSENVCSIAVGAIRYSSR